MTGPSTPDHSLPSPAPAEPREAVATWFHYSEEICEHDGNESRYWPCEIMTDNLLEAFTVTLRTRTAAPAGDTGLREALEERSKDAHALSSGRVPLSNCIGDWLHCHSFVCTRDRALLAALAANPSTARDAAHPEATCQRCGGPNLTWHAPSPLWNAVMRDANGNDAWEIVCPACFAELAESRGVVRGVWHIAPEPMPDLPQTNRDGRVWDPGQCLWVEALPPATASTGPTGLGASRRRSHRRRIR